MGRHGGGPDPHDEPAHRLLAWLEHVLVGVAAGGVVALILRWAGTAPRTSVTVGIVVLALVTVAAWLASTVPAPAEPDDGADDRPADRRSRRG